MVTICKVSKCKVTSCKVASCTMASCKVSKCMGIDRLRIRTQAGCQAERYSHRFPPPGKIENDILAGGGKG
jgi:hypothetical protein